MPHLRHHVLENRVGELFSMKETPELSEDQRERMLIIFSMLVSLFERAYLVLYAKRMSDRQRRRWLSWEDYMREWCSRDDFRSSLPTLVRGEDSDFVVYLQGLAASGQSGTAGE